MSIIINLKDLYPSDSQQQLTEKVNYNFNQMLRLGVGQPGPQGIPGPPGGQGIPGMPGATGRRGSWWYSGPNSVPDPLLPDVAVDDYYLTYAAGNLAMWQYQAGSPDSWVKVVNLEDAIQSHISATSPFTRPSGSSIPANWASVILPLPVPGSATWNNTLLIACENQDLLYTCSYSTSNATQLRKTQLALLNGSQSPVEHTLMIGEVGYDYSGGPIYSDPKVQINNTMRISAKYVSVAPTVRPAYSHGVFDMYSPDDGLRSDDTTTTMSFYTRYFSGVNRGSLSVMFASRESFNQPGMDTGSLNDIALAPVDFGGIVVRNTSVPTYTSAVALGTNMNFAYPTVNTPYSYLLSNDVITRLYVNTDITPFRHTDPNKWLALGTYGNAGATHWDAVFAKQMFGYASSDFRFFRNTGNASFISDFTNNVMTLTGQGKVAVGRALFDYKGVGNVYGLAFGTNPTSTGNDNNRAVVHIYEDLASAPTHPAVNEAGLVVEKRWGFLDRYPGVAGVKMGAAINNVVRIVGTTPPGIPGSLYAPDATALAITQGQESTNLTKGFVTNMRGVNLLMYAGANAASMGAVVGVTSQMQFQKSGGSTTTRALSYSAFYANVPAKDGATEYIVTMIGGMPAKYGYYQDGATNALNYFKGHIQFGGSGDGYVLPVYTSPPYDTHTGHTIAVAGNDGVGGGNLTLIAATGSGAAPSGKVYLYGGPANGTDGGGVLINGGVSVSSAGFTGGRVSIIAGVGYGNTQNGGDLLLQGGIAAGAPHGTPGNVVITPGLGTNFAGTLTFNDGVVAIGYYKPSSTPYNVGGVGFGTAAPKEKVHVMGNVALGSGAGRKIYVRPGTAGANVDMEGTGAGGYLAVAAGNAEHHSALHRGGHLYLYGGNYSGTPAGPIPAYGYQGNVHLAYDESSAAVGRVGIRKAAPQAATEDYDVHVDVNGNVRTNGDIMWGDAGSVPGWKVMWNGAYTMTPPTIPFRFFVIDGGGYIIELTSGNLGSSNMYIRCKRVGSFAILNFRLEFNGVAPMSGREHAFMAWDPSNPQVSWLGSILPQRTTPFTDPTEASYSSAIDRYNSVVFKPCSVDAAYSATATWSGAIPANRNVVHFYSTPAFGAYSHICGQIVMEMTL